MKITKQARRDAKGLFRATLVKGVMERTKVLQVVSQVLAGKPRGYLAILEHFKRLVMLEEERRAARVETAVALTPDQQANVSGILRRTHGDGLTISFQQNAALIGGMRVKVGSDVFDGSLTGRLQALEETF